MEQRKQFNEEAHFQRNHGNRIRFPFRWHLANRYAKFFCSIFVGVSIVFAVISLVTVAWYTQNGNAILAVCSAVFVALKAAIFQLSMYVR